MNTALYDRRPGCLQAAAAAVKRRFYKNLLIIILQTEQMLTGRRPQPGCANPESPAEHVVPSIDWLATISLQNEFRKEDSVSWKHFQDSIVKSSFSAALPAASALIAGLISVSETALSKYFLSVFLNTDKDESIERIHWLSFNLIYVLTHIILNSGFRAWHSVAVINTSCSEFVRCPRSSFCRILQPPCANFRRKHYK